MYDLWQRKKIFGSSRASTSPSASLVSKRRPFVAYSTVERFSRCTSRISDWLMKFTPSLWCSMMRPLLAPLAGIALMCSSSFSACSLWGCARPPITCRMRSSVFITRSTLNGLTM